MGCADLRHLWVIVARKPKAALFRGETRTELSARVCGDCGYTELFAENPSGLFEAYSESAKTAHRA
jgi:hypothetical protein